SKTDKKLLFNKQKATILEKNQNIAKFLNTKDLKEKKYLIGHKALTTLIAFNKIKNNDNRSKKIVKETKVIENNIVFIEATNAIRTISTGDFSYKRIYDNFNKVEAVKNSLIKEIKEIILLNEYKILNYGLEEHLTKKKTEYNQA
ncbi:376_t:CDS:2, partial [Gigaspora rosea]